MIKNFLLLLFYFPFDLNLKSVINNKLPNIERKDQFEFVKGKYGNAILLKGLTFNFVINNVLQYDKVILSTWIKKSDINVFHIHNRDDIGWFNINLDNSYLSLTQGITTHKVFVNFNDNNFHKIIVIFDLNYGNIEVYFDNIKKIKFYADVWNNNNTLIYIGYPYGNAIYDDLKIYAI
jgi:hypothetical protein